MYDNIVLVLVNNCFTFYIVTFFYCDYSC